MRPIMTLTTDFGTSDGYVGVMKGVILGICPHAHLIDLTHTIPPQDLVAASLVLQTSIDYFPDGTVHLVVVDPGVGSTRRPLLLSTPRAHFIGPDNGIFAPLWREALERWAPAQVQAIELTQPAFWRPQISTTFHGRDIFAPVAAHLASGVAPTEMGTPLDSLVTLSLPQPVRDEHGTITGQVIALDHFGNAITNITADLLPSPPSRLRLRLSPESADRGTPLAPLALHTTYADVAPGEPLALIGSSQRLEVAICQGNASQQLAITTGTIVHVEPAGPKS